MHVWTLAIEMKRVLEVSERNTQLLDMPQIILIISILQKNPITAKSLLRYDAIGVIAG